MKLAPVFLIAFLLFVSCSCYSKRYFNWPNHRPYVVLVPTNSELEDEIPDVQSRRMSPFSVKQQNKPQNKFFIPGGLLYNLLRTSSTSSSSAAPVSVSTMTVTSYNTISSTATIAVIQSCITSTQFAQAAGGFLTTTCGRRKRSSPDELLAEVEPSRVVPIEASQAFRHYYDVQPRQEPDIVSSFYDPEDADDEHVRPRQQFLFSSVAASSSSPQQQAISVVTVTSNITVYSFQTTSVKRFFTLVAPNAFLQCLPVGYTPC